VIKIGKDDWKDIDWALKPMAEWLRQQAERDPIPGNKEKNLTWADQIDALRERIGKGGEIAAREGVEPVQALPGCGGGGCGVAP